MAFTVNARTIFHLGADLISSDGIAFYELIKNAFDARSPDVDVEVVIRLPTSTYIDFVRKLEAPDSGRRLKESDIRAMCRQLTQAITPEAPGADELRLTLEQCDSLSQLRLAIKGSNYIDIKDTGVGMSAKDLEEVYLTVGTPHRLLEKQALALKHVDSPKPILGEKGIGRLAAMRLGSSLRVDTTKMNEQRWNVLEINWDDFRGDESKRLEEVDVRPSAGRTKDRPTLQGTHIRITGLTGDWTSKHLEKIVSEEFSKLNDPFSEVRFPIHAYFNGKLIAVPKLDRVLLENAHASCTARFEVDESKIELTGEIEYRLRDESHAFRLEGVELLAASDAPSLDLLRSLGPFKLTFHWFNRLQLNRLLKGSGELKELIQSLLQHWGGGLMVYRDGFRVNPYGTGQDDWLSLDPAAFKSAGYKVNRSQIVGKVDISSVRNPALVDQTNREGLRDCPEKSMLVHLLQHILMSEFKSFLEKCDEVAAGVKPLTVRQIDTRVGHEAKRMRQTLKMLRREYPDVDKTTGIAETINETFGRIKELMEQARQQVQTYKKARDTFMNLAATGLLVELLAHELNRATRHTMAALADLKKSDRLKTQPALFATLESQLKTLQKRLRLIDPMAAGGRQVKETFDLASWVETILSSHADQFERHQITAKLEVFPEKPVKGVPVTMVKGMVVQILENLISNSVYWLKQQSRLQPKLAPEIVVRIDLRERTLSVTDNGPGIDPSRRDQVFHAYFTTKPANEGKGLGLFISQELAKYHKLNLTLSDAPSVHPDRLNTFVLSLGNVLQ